MKLEAPSREPDYIYPWKHSYGEGRFWFDEMICGAYYDSRTVEFERMVVGQIDDDGCGPLYDSKHPTGNSYVEAIQEAYVNWLAEKELLR